MSLRKVIGNVFPFEKVFWSISRPPMADLVCAIQTPKQAMMVSLLSDSTCPTLKVSERPFLCFFFWSLDTFPLRADSWSFS
jgi:hypothetical protein